MHTFSGAWPALVTPFTKQDTVNISVLSCDTRLHVESENTVPQANVHACSQVLHASLVTVGCEARTNV